MADISNVINITLLQDQALAATDNMNIVAIMTSDNTFLNSDNRYQSYRNIQEVTDDFGSLSEVTSYAQVFFAQQPNPVNARGELIIGYWRAVAETVPATSGFLLGAQINEVNVVSQLQTITAGEFSVTIDSVAVPLTDLDFSTISSMDDAIFILQAALSTASVFYDNLQIRIRSNTTGVASTVSYATGSGDDYIGNLLNLNDGSGAVIVGGEASVVLPVESETDALAAVKTLVDFKGYCFIDQPIADEQYNMAVWSEANKTLGFEVFTGASALVKNIANAPWNIKIASLVDFRMLYRKDNDRKYACAYMSRAHTVNFNAENSALTMNLKTLIGITPEDYTQSQINSADIIGLDLYTTIKNVPVNLCGSGNDFFDNRYNILAYINEVQVALFNVLKGTPTKIPQTTQGVSQLTDSVTKVSEKYVAASVFAPGTWTSPETFGDYNQFNRAIEQNGYYVLAGLLANQPQEDRANRKSPVIQVAVKNAGAIHSADLIINFNL